MRISRIYLPLEPKQIQQCITIHGDKAHYIRNVLRNKCGQKLNFFTPSGTEYQGTISAINKHDVTLNQVEAITSQPKPSTLNTTLVQGISSSDRMDYSIQKAAELGCQLMQPVLTDFCSHKIPSHKQAKKHAHWQAVAVSACEQSGRADLMQVTPILNLSQVISNTAEAIYLEPGAATHINQLPGHMQVNQCVFIGPEGGFSPPEIEAFEAAKYLGVQLGQRVLRTETVAPVIMSALHSLYGDFKPQTE